MRKQKGYSCSLQRKVPPWRVSAGLVVMSPFSLPVMQLGFDKYLEITHWEPVLFETLMKVNEDFCAEWAHAQLLAGATAMYCLH